jgi:hypothetical protein
MRSLVMLLPIVVVSPIASRTTGAILKRYLVVQIDPQAQITLQQQLCSGQLDVFSPGNKAVAGSISSSGH